MPGPLTARRHAMADTTRTPRPITRGRLYASSPEDRQHETDGYNRSSLALDPEETFPRRPFPSQVVEWPHPPAAVAPHGALWRGEDPFKYERSKTTTVVSFILHGAVLGAVIYLGLNFKVVIPAVKKVTGVNITLY